MPVPPEQAWLSEVVMQVMPEAGDTYRHVERRDDAAWIGNRLAEMLPLSLADKQTLLELIAARAHSAPPVVLVLDDLHVYRGRADTVKDIARKIVNDLGPESSMALIQTGGFEGEHGIGNASVTQD